MQGGYGRGWRHRRQFYSTGIPGYGRGRCLWDHPARGRAGVAYPGTPADNWGGFQPELPELSREDELKMLEEEEQMLRQELDEVSRMIEALRKEIEKEVE